MKNAANFSGASHFLITAASFVVVVAGMRVAQSIIVPLLLALFIAVICSPLLAWMKKRGVPNTLAVILIVVTIFAIGSLLVTAVSASLSSFSENLPLYEKRMTEKTAIIHEWLTGMGWNISSGFMKDTFSTGNVMKMAANLLSSIGTVFTNTLLIFLTVIFILLEAAGFPAKLSKALGSNKKSLDRLSSITGSINRYLAIKTIFSLSTGIILTIWLTIIGVDYAILWGLLAFLLNYVPNIGSIIAAIPAILLAFIQLGLWDAGLVAAGYVVVNLVAGSILEPKFMGRGLGLSTLIVFLSLVLWGWVLGPVGMFLSVPLTVILKIFLEGNEDTRPIAVLMG